MRKRKREKERERERERKQRHVRESEEVSSPESRRRSTSPDHLLTEVKAGLPPCD